MKVTDRNRLRHTLDAATESLGFIEGKSRMDLCKNRMLALALTRQIEIIGEAASKVSPECRAGIPGIPWTKIVGTRHRVVHAYFDIDLEIVWSTVCSDFPQLIQMLGTALGESA